MITQRSGMCVCVRVCVFMCVCELTFPIFHQRVALLMVILADISHYSQSFRTKVPLFWWQHASIMMYISVLNHPHDTSDTGVYYKYCKLARLHSYIFRNVECLNVISFYQVSVRTNWLTFAWSSQIPQPQFASNRVSASNQDQRGRLAASCCTWMEPQRVD